jgi:LmbE family N-acetylglucosaminyl deacetylase
MRVLGVGAHPDDLEILCGGTLAKYARQGHDVFMCHVCRGDKGHFEIPPDELARIRDEEARRAAAIINARTFGPFADDLDLFVTREMILRLVEVIRETKPDIIITHSPDDYMPDHIAASHIVFSASFTATLPHFRTRSEAHTKVTPIYHTDVLAGVGPAPTEYVDITDTFDVKRQMLSEHKSQITWLKSHDNVDVLEYIETIAKFRGLQCGVKYAEGFRQVRTWGRIIPNRLLP